MDTDYGSLIHGKVQSVKLTLEIKGATRLYTKVIYMSATTIGKNTIIITIINLFSIINLDFLTSKQISTYRKLKLLAFLTSEMQERLQQTKVYYAFCYFALKEMTQKPKKRVATKTHFFSVYVITTTCSDECFFIVYDNWNFS